MPTTRDPELTRLLTMELQRHLVALEANAGKADAEALESTRRAVHALKGSAGLAGEPELASAMQRLERRLREGDHGALADIVETVKRAIRRLSAGETAIAVAWPEPPPDLGPAALDPLLRAQYLAEITDRLAQIDACLGRAGDPIDAASDVYRHVHTMKGAASAVGDEPMAWFCHGLEERLRGASATLDAATAALQEVAGYRAVLGALLDDTEAALATLRGLPGRLRTSLRPPSEDEARSADGDATIRVPAQSVDRLLDHVGGIAVARERVA
ncbi:MAG TPA: Hpt domain-containing protein, partial [Labilithrix sp.]|nr:Hpt domain-containing protein [Labilithrix sp.]